MLRSYDTTPHSVLFHFQCFNLLFDFVVSIIPLTASDESSGTAPTPENPGNVLIAISI